MSSKNASDLIECYLKELLTGKHEIEIKRSELAATFDVVPSQINYVIKTRFTIPKGYEVESKRGGGGYIRIVKIRYSSKHDHIQDIYNSLPPSLDENIAIDIIRHIYEQDFISYREGQFVLSMMRESNFTGDSGLVRLNLMKSFLQRLDREYE
jgi:Transcriptional repressor of class III stress genes